MSEFVKNPMFEASTKFTISKVPVFYAKVLPDYYDSYEGRDRWKITAQLDLELAAKMEANGFNIKYSEEGDAFLEASRNLKTKGGKELTPPIIVFEDGTKYDAEEHGFIGNGTICDLKVSAMYVTMKQKQGRQMVDVTYLPCYLDKIIIKEFVSYEGADSGDAKDIF